MSVFEAGATVYSSKHQIYVGSKLLHLMKFNENTLQIQNKVTYLPYIKFRITMLCWSQVEFII